MHSLAPTIDSEALRRLRESRVLLVGMGGLGSPAALGLATAGVGAIVCVDFDRVDVTNLQRQVIFRNDDVGRWKVEAARDRLHALAPDLDVEVVREPFGPDNALRLLADVDLVVDGADNFATRFLVNDACVLGGRPNVFGSVSRFDGQVGVFAAPGGPCYRCLHPEPPPEGLIPSCAEGGVLGVLPGVVGALQTVEAVKMLTGIGTPLIGRLLIYDALRMKVRDIVLPRDPDCPVCGDEPTIGELVATGPVCMVVDATSTIDPAELRDWRRRRLPHVLIDVREPAEFAAGAIDLARSIPLAHVRDELQRLRPTDPIVVYCRSGLRSGRAVAMLREVGIEARSLSGGIEAWHAREPSRGAPP